MSQLDQIFTDIAESIIEKDQGEGMKPTEMAERITNLPSGGGSSDFLIGISPNECKATDEVN